MPTRLVRASFPKTRVSPTVKPAEELTPSISTLEPVAQRDFWMLCPPWRGNGIGLLSMDVLLRVVKGGITLTIDRSLIFNVSSILVLHALSLSWLCWHSEKLQKSIAHWKPENSKIYAALEVLGTLCLDSSDFKVVILGRQTATSSPELWHAPEAGWQKQKSETRV